MLKSTSPIASTLSSSMYSLSQATLSDISCKQFTISESGHNQWSFLVGFYSEEAAGSVGYALTAMKRYKKVTFSKSSDLINEVIKIHFNPWC